MLFLQGKKKKKKDRGSPSKPKKKKKIIQSPTFSLWTPSTPCPHLSSPLCSDSSKLVYLFQPTKAPPPMIRFENLPPEVIQAMCTPMHLILPASAQQLTGALCLGSFSFSAILDPGLLGSHHSVALVVLDALCLPRWRCTRRKGSSSRAIGWIYWTRRRRT